MPFADFRDGAQRVKSLRVLSITIFQATPKVAKARVGVESVEKDEEGKTWKKRKRIGELTLIPENGIWRLIQVDIKQFKKR